MATYGFTYHQYGRDGRTICGLATNYLSKIGEPGSGRYASYSEPGEHECQICFAA